ncbi:MAG: hypothetical protein WCY89_05985 [Flavobacteriaceae bacterium]
MKQCAYYSEGKTGRITFVFSCPGKEEQDNNKPVAGKTGCNLELLLKELKKRDFITEDFKDRYDFRITNSHNEVHYKALNNRTEPLNSKIKEEDNLQRLLKELKETEIIICFGEKSKYAVHQIKGNLNEKTKILYSRHLGLMSLNQIRDDIQGKPLESGNKENTIKRIEVIAQNLTEQHLNN